MQVTVNVTTPPRNLNLALAGFLALSFLPCLMNAFPRHFAWAFSEHWDRWTGTSLLIMTGIVAAWSWAAMCVGREWRRKESPVRFSISRRSEVWRLPGGTRAICRRAFIFHGPILVGLFYLMWVSARFSLGRWPYHGGQDDPSGIVGTMFVYFAICAWFWLGILALVLPLFRAGLELRRRDGAVGKAAWEFLATLALLVAALAFLSTDPHGLLTWFLD